MNYQKYLRKDTRSQILMYNQRALHTFCSEPYVSGQAILLRIQSRHLMLLTVMYMNQ